MSVSDNVVAVYRATNNTVQPDLYVGGFYGDIIEPTLTYTLDEDGLYTITLQSAEPIDCFQFLPDHTQYITEIGFLDLSNVTTLEYSIITEGSSALKKIDGKDWVTSKVEDIYTFISDYAGTIEEVIVPNLVTSACRTLEDVFAGVQGPIDTSNWDLSNATKISNIFWGCALEELDISSWKFSEENPIKVVRICNECYNLKTVHLIKDGYDGWRQARISEVVDMFDDCQYLTQVAGIKDLNMSECTSISHIFSGCGSYTDFSFLPIWDMDNVINFDGIVSGCESRIDVLDYSHWNPEKCQRMAYLAGVGNDIGTIYVNGNFNVRNTETLEYLFAETKVDSIVGLENFDFTNVKELSGIVQGLITNQSEYKKMEQWRDLSSVEYMYYIWSESNVETIDISNWIVTSVLVSNSLFENCPNLTHVKHYSIPHTICQAKAAFMDSPNLVEITGFNNFYYVNDYDGSLDFCENYWSCEKLEYIDFSNVKIGYHPDPDYSGPFTEYHDVVLLGKDMPSLKKINLSGLRVNSDYGSFRLGSTKNIVDYPNLTKIILNDSHSNAINSVISRLPNRTGNDPGYLNLYNTEDIENVNLASAEAANWIITYEAEDENENEDEKVKAKTLAIRFKNSMIYLYHKGKRLI
jgi:hypothetical protein